MYRLMKPRKLESFFAILALFLFGLMPATLYAGKPKTGKKVAALNLGKGTTKTAKLSSKKTGLSLNKKVDNRPSWAKALSASASLANAFGTGSFAPSSYKNHFFAQSLALSLGVRLPARFSVRAGWNFSWEYTDPNNASGRKFFPGETTLSVSWRDPILALKKIVNTGLSVSFDLPSSYLARMSTRYVRLGTGLSLSRRFGIVMVSYQGTFSKSFHKYTTPVFNQGNFDMPSLFASQAVSDLLKTSDLGPGEMPVPAQRNISWQIGNTLAVNVFILKTLSAGVSYSIFNAFKYPMPKRDEFTPEINTVNGTMLGDARGRVDFTSSNIFVSWNPIRYLGLTLGLRTMQPPFSADNKSLRLPFFNFFTPNNNFTNIYFNITGRY